MFVATLDWCFCSCPIDLGFACSKVLYIVLGLCIIFLGLYIICWGLCIVCWGLCWKGVPLQSTFFHYCFFHRRNVSTHLALLHDLFPAMLPPLILALLPPLLHALIPSLLPALLPIRFPALLIKYTPECNQTRQLYDII